VTETFFHAHADFIYLLEVSNFPAAMKQTLKTEILARKIVFAFKTVKGLAMDQDPKLQLKTHKHPMVMASFQGNRNLFKIMQCSEYKQ